MRSLIYIVSLFCFNLYAKESTSIAHIVDTQCMNCHNDAAMTNVPLLAGQKQDFLEFELFNFRDYVLSLLEEDSVVLP